jgi:hypothetical protein
MSKKNALSERIAYEQAIESINKQLKFIKT